jgi:hypothetical protein
LIASRKKGEITYKGKPIRIAAYFSTGTRSKKGVE